MAYWRSNSTSSVSGGDSFGSLRGGGRGGGKSDYAAECGGRRAEKLRLGNYCSSLFMLLADGF